MSTLFGVSTLFPELLRVGSVGGSPWSCRPQASAEGARPARRASAATGSSTSPNSSSGRSARARSSDRIGKLTDLVFRLTEPYPEAVGIYIEHGWGKPTRVHPLGQGGQDRGRRHLRPAARRRRDLPAVRGPARLDPARRAPHGQDHPRHGRPADRGGQRRAPAGIQGPHAHGPRGHLLQRLPAPVGPRAARAGSRTSSSPGSTSSPSPWRTRWPPTRSRSRSPASRSRNCPARTWPTPSRSSPARSSRPCSPPSIRRRPPRRWSRPSRGPSGRSSPTCARRRARTILSEMSVPQLADLFSVLPHDDMTELMGLLPEEQAGAHPGDPLRAGGDGQRRSCRRDFVAVPQGGQGRARSCDELRPSEREPDAISYIYVVERRRRTLVGRRGPAGAGPRRGPHDAGRPHGLARGGRRGGRPSRTTWRNCSPSTTTA